MADFPALPLWTDAYLADTRHLSTIEHGAYLLLLMEAWRRPNCDLPADDKLLARLAGLSAGDWLDVAPAVMELWQLDGRRKVWKQKRLSKERLYLDEKRASQRDKARSRWNKTEKSNAAAMPEGMPEACRSDAPTPTPTPTPPIDNNATALSVQNRGFGLEADAENRVDGEASDSAAEDKPKPPVTPDLTPDQFAEAWNKLADRLGKPKVQFLTPERRTRLNARIKGFTLDQFREVLRKVDQSAFLRGDRDWQGCNFDWITKKANFIKVLEGNYDQ